MEAAMSQETACALLVIYKRVHQQALINEFLPLRLFIGQVTIVVI